MSARLVDLATGEPAEPRRRVVLAGADAAASAPAAQIASPAASRAQRAHGRWKLEASAALDGLSRADELHAGPGCWIARSESRWRIFDAVLAPVADGPVAPGALAVDAERGLLLTPANGGLWRGWRLGDGAEAFALGLCFGHAYQVRSARARDGSLRLLSTTLPHPVLRNPNEHWGIELRRLGDPVELDDLGLARSSRTERALRAEGSDWLVAESEAGCAFARRDRIALFDARLDYRAQIDGGGFAPIALAMHGSGRLQAIVERAPGAACEFWSFAADGERDSATTFDPAWARRIAALLPAPADRAWAIAGDRIAALDPSGQSCWEFRSASSLGPVRCDADGRLWVAQGAELLVFDPDGECAAVHGFEEAIAAAPAFGRDGQVAVLTQSQLCLLRQVG